MIYDSGAAECTMKLILTRAVLADLAEPASFPAYLFNVRLTAHALQCYHRGKFAARDKKKRQ